jgi:hypothetical protein
MKKIERSNFRVELKGTIHLDVADGPVAALASRVAVAGSIDPRRLGDFGFMSMSDRLASRDVEGDYRRRCEDLVRWLRDMYGSQVKAEVLWDEAATCSHCGYPWEVLTAEDVARYADMLGPDETVGLPQCCTAAQAEWRAAQAGVTA